MVQRNKERQNISEEDDDICLDVCSLQIGNRQTLYEIVSSGGNVQEPGWQKVDDVDREIISALVH